MKYFEREADRFAYEHARSREEIEAAQNFFITQRQSEINDVVGLEQYLKQYSQLKIIEKALTVDIVRFIWDPSQQTRITMGQYYLDKWDNEH